MLYICYSLGILLITCYICIIKIIYMKFNMKGKKLLVQLPEKENVTEAGLFIPDGATMDVKANIKKVLGIVLEVGSKVDESISEGDYVLSDPYIDYMHVTHPDT